MVQNSPDSAYLSHVFDVNVSPILQMKQFHVDDPSDLCSIKISGQELREVQYKKKSSTLMFSNIWRL